MKSLTTQDLSKIGLTACFMLLSFISYSQYCNSYGTTIYNDGVTYVSFNTVSKADIIKNNGYEDFTNIYTNIYKGSTYNLTVHVNTDGNYRNYVKVWIDWNGDGDFIDAGEEYDMGYAQNVSNGPTTSSPRSITVPLTAVVGTTRMRVSTKYNSYPSSSCETGFDGEVEDYTLIIKQGTNAYCNSFGNTNYNDGITNVAFNTINNSDINKDNGYEDFTSISTNVYRGSTYNLAVNINTDGDYRNYAKVWIDWNRDGDFIDAGEEYDMGSAKNVVNGATSNSPRSVVVPLTAVVGTTRMRVSTKYNSYPSSSCETGFDGEVEDYTINVLDNYIGFNGTSDYIDFADRHDLTSSFSLEAWVYQKASVATGTIISKGNIDATTKTGYHLSLKNRYPNIIWYNNSNNAILNLTSPYAIPNNQWHHIVVSYNGSLVNMYVDGINVVSATPSSPPLNTIDNFLIGADTRNSTTTPSNMNYFDGAIQEVRVWNVALSESQIREMMNQHIEQNTTNVKGTETRLNISAGVLWSNLRGYYPLNSNNAFDSSSYNIDGIPQGMTTSQIITAPLPYKTANNSAWNTPSTWLNTSDVSIPNSIGIDGTTSIDWNIVELSNNITSGNRDISVLGLVSLSGTLTMDGLTDINTGTGTGQSLTISHYLELDGVIDLVGESQLIQLEGSILDADSGGALERDQQGTANGFNYNYWSSSVGPITGDSGSRGTGIAKLNTNYTISGMLNDGTSPSSYLPINFSASYSAADSNSPTTPRTISTYWMYKFYGPDDDYNAWAKINEVFSLLPGEGFTMKGTSGSALVSSNQNYVFKGLPYNGDIMLPLQKISGTDDVERLIGNPYPSAIDARAFILDNLSTANGGTNTVNVIDGAIYFWDHFGQQNSHDLRNYVGGYATFNLTGGAPAISNDIRINNNGSFGTKTPGDFIAVNQGFFVSTVGATGGNVIFKNSQRVFEKEAIPTSVFFKPAQTKSKSNNSTVSNYSNPLIRLLYDSPEGYHRQIAIGTNKNATNGFNLGYDAIMADVNEEDMYWSLEDKKLVIQGVTNFDDSQEYPLGLIIKKSGTARIKLYALENIEASKALFIKDMSTNATYPINEAPFEIYLEAGTYTDRFKLVFKQNQENALAVTDFNLEKKVSVYFNSEVSELKINVLFETKVFDVTVYNLMGQKITYTNTIKSSEITLPIKVSTGAYIIRINTMNGIINKKIIME
tara:strand:- start:3833 stop:7462 length:3630 start_codon:yes stop_codon:yes gene_type:complete